MNDDKNKKNTGQNQKLKIEAVKGTRDFYPDLMQFENFIFDTWRSVSKKYGYEEFDGPVLESAELWKLKSGEEIPQQMYTLNDKNGDLLALRPELTPTLARMIAQKQKTLSKPIKWFSIPRCYRYERPQAGRLREFFQLNVDCIGNNDIYSDAEIIAIGINIMIQFGFTKDDFYVRISDRTLLNEILSEIGVNNSKDVFRLIDKKLKISIEEFDIELKKLSKNSKLIKEFLIIDNLDKLNKFIIKNKLKNESLKKSFKELKELFNYLESYGYSNYIQFDPTITRGFDYYTRTVFEIYDKSQKFRAIAGGGRYDNLVKDFGGEQLSGVGFGMGDIVLGLFLESKGLIPNYKKEFEYYTAIIPEDNEIINEKLKEYGIQISQKLRQENKSVFLELNLKKLGKALEYCNKNNISKVVIVGKAELDKKTYVIKDMVNKTEKIEKF